MTWRPKPGNRPKTMALGKVPEGAADKPDAGTGTALTVSPATATGGGNEGAVPGRSRPSPGDEATRAISDGAAGGFASSFEPDYMRYAEPRTPWSARLAIWTTLGTVIATVVWMAFATVDSQIIARGIVEPLVRKTVVQSFHSGVLRVIDVEIGERVLKGQPLAWVKNESTAANLNSIQFDLTSTSARISRISAELNNREPERFSTDDRVEQLGREIFNANQAAYADAMALFDIQLIALKDAIKAHRTDIGTMQKQMGYLNELSVMREDLFKKEKEYFKRNGPRRIEYLQAKKAEGEGRRQINKLETDLQTLYQKKREVEKKRSQYLSERRANLSAQMEESALKLSAAKMQLAKYQEARSLVQLVAPFDGIITSVTQKAPGTMIEAGEVLIAMVPDNSRLRAAVDIMPSDIARVYVDAPATIKLDSLPFNKHGVLRGRVELITNDVNDKTVMGQRDMVFRSWISIDDDQLRNKPDAFAVRPGMTLEVNIKTKERTVLFYLIYPITRGLSQSLIEP